jgi:hypothetical protein
MAAGICEVIALAEYRHDDRGPALLLKAGTGLWLWDGERRIPWRIKGG